MISEERIAELREAYKRRGANTDVALDHLIRTAAREAAAEQVRKDATICLNKGVKDCAMDILAQLPPTKTEGK